LGGTSDCLGVLF
jgi:hypothetical protein